MLHGPFPRIVHFGSDEPKAHRLADEWRKQGYLAKYVRRIVNAAGASSLAHVIVLTGIRKDAESKEE